MPATSIDVLISSATRCRRLSIRGDRHATRVTTMSSTRRTRPHLLVRGAISPGQEPRLQLAPAFDLERAPLLQPERLAQEQAGALRDLYPSGHAVRFHPAGGVDGITPHIVEIQPLTD